MDDIVPITMVFGTDLQRHQHRIICASLVLSLVPGCERANSFKMTKRVTHRRASTELSWHTTAGQELGSVQICAIACLPPNLGTVPTAELGPVRE